MPVAITLWLKPQIFSIIFSKIKLCCLLNNFKIQTSIDIAHRGMCCIYKVFKIWTRNDGPSEEFGVKLELIIFGFTMNFMFLSSFAIVVSNYAVNDINRIAMRSNLLYIYIYIYIYYSMFTYVYVHQNVFLNQCRIVGNITKQLGTYIYGSH